MRTVWVNPAPAGPSYTKQDIIFVDSSISGVESPMPAGNPVVPAGWVMQIAADGSQDTLLKQTGIPGGVDIPTQFLPNIVQPVVNYWTGGPPTDPLLGTIGHQPCPTVR